MGISFSLYIGKLLNHSNFRGKPSFSFRDNASNCLLLGDKEVI